jgi:hypothetical protein
MRIDNSLLQAGALVGIAILAGVAAQDRQWGIVTTAITGFFAVLSIHPKDTPASGGPTAPAASDGAQPPAAGPPQ